MSKKIATTETTVHYLSGHGTWAGGEDVGTYCGRNYEHKHGFPGYWEGDKVFAVSRKHSATSFASRVTCEKCKAEMKAERKAHKADMKAARKSGEDCG